MITVEDKLDIFYKLVYVEEEQKCIKKMEELDSMIKDTLEQKKKELEQKKQTFIERKVFLANIQKNEMISQANENHKISILQDRERLLDKTLIALEAKAKDFVKSEDYKTYLINKISNALSNMDEKQIIVTLNKGDDIKIHNSIKELENKYNKSIVVETSNEDIIGGFMIQDIQKTFNLDNSFKIIIEDNKYEIGKRLFSSLENAGDIIG